MDQLRNVAASFARSQQTFSAFYIQIKTCLFIGQTKIFAAQRFAKYFQRLSSDSKSFVLLLTTFSKQNSLRFQGALHCDNCLLFYFIFISWPCKGKLYYIPAIDDNVGFLRDAHLSPHFSVHKRSHLIHHWLISCLEIKYTVTAIKTFRSYMQVCKK